jgi:hypothetical protein
VSGQLASASIGVPQVHEDVGGLRHLRSLLLRLALLAARHIRILQIGKIIIKLSTSIWSVFINRSTYLLLAMKKNFVAGKNRKIIPFSNNVISFEKWLTGILSCLELSCRNTN